MLRIRYKLHFFFNLANHLELELGVYFTFDGFCNATEQALINCGTECIGEHEPSMLEELNADCQSLRNCFYFILFNNSVGCMI